MNRMMRAAATAALLVGGLGSVGCVNTGTTGCGSGGGGCGAGGCGIGGARGEGHGPLGDCWRNAVDPCYPERYWYAARQATVYPFAQQVLNGHVLNQTIWNYYFDFGTDVLTPAGIEKLNSLVRTRPAPDPRIYIQTARDIPATVDPLKIPEIRTDLDARRAEAIRKHLASQPQFAPVAYEVYVHDSAVPSINAEMAMRAYNGSFLGYRGGVSGAGTGVLGTGGGFGGGTGGGIGGFGPGGAGVGGTFGSGSFGAPPAGGPGGR
jgi:hypothetical protein